MDNDEYALSKVSYSKLSVFIIYILNGFFRIGFSSELTAKTVQCT